LSRNLAQTDFHSDKPVRLIGVALVAIGLVLLSVAVLLAYLAIPPVQATLNPQPTPAPNPVATPPPPKFAVTPASQSWDMSTWGDGQSFIAAYVIVVPPGDWYDTGIIIKPGMHVIWNYTNGTSGRGDIRIGKRIWADPATPLQGNAYHEVQAMASGKPDTRLFVVHDVPTIEFRSYENFVWIKLEVWFQPRYEHPEQRAASQPQTRKTLSAKRPASQRDVTGPDPTIQRPTLKRREGGVPWNDKPE
jgi:hypothetical protein